MGSRTVCGTRFLLGHAYFYQILRSDYLLLFALIPQCHAAKGIGLFRPARRCYGKRSMNSASTHRLVCPFMTEDLNFSYGVEFGLLHARMRRGNKRIKDYFCRANQERILLLANRLGWSVRKIKAWDQNWFYCILEKRRGTRP